MDETVRCKHWDIIVRKLCGPLNGMNSSQEGGEPKLSCSRIKIAVCKALDWNISVSMDEVEKWNKVIHMMKQ